jgi:hypothetical protein
MQELENLSAVIVATAVLEGVNDKPVVGWYCSLSVMNVL